VPRQRLDARQIVGQLADQGHLGQRELGGARIAIVQFRPDDRGEARVAAPGAQQLLPGTAIGLAYSDEATAAHVDLLATTIR